MALSDAKIRTAKPKEKSYKLFDGQGLYILVKPNASKLWQMKYHINEKEKTLSFGPYPQTTLAMARAKATDARRILQDGNDPSIAKKQQKLKTRTSQLNTFGAIANEWLKKRINDGLAASTISKRQWVIEKKLLPSLKDLPISTITPQQLLAVLRNIEKEGHNETAHRAKSVAGQIFRYAIATGRATVDPSRDLLGALVTVQVTHHASITEPEKLAPLLQAMQNYSGTHVVKTAMQISAYLFQRPGEIRTMRWEDINFTTAEWRYKCTKTNTPHIVPLATQVVKLLNELKPSSKYFSEHNKPIYVFPSVKGRNKSLSEGGVRTALKRMGFGNGIMSAHGFRATARTILDEVLNIRVDLIEHQLAHAVKDPNGRAYNRTKHLEQRKEMMQKWADYIDRLKLVNDDSPTLQH